MDYLTHHLLRASAQRSPAKEALVQGERRLSYAELKKGEVNIQGKRVQTGSMSSYSKALQIANILKDEIKRGDFPLSQPYQALAQTQSMGALKIVDQNNREVRP